MAGTKPIKPAEPYQEFPIFAHASGQWAKKIKGKMWYFGVWENPEAAYETYESQIDEIHAGRNPRRVV
ncbi:MAG TPA: hypothetical protein PLY87_24675 [Planctomycetaceae bacterium]|nr:hypothetical protein [Planctomycetaceae bacterium]HQZ68315.1 hypothetical protein [Planctomycetaceae bacterium]HRA88779.1 hypothetical protein [Planctomycetaceae bacterium]